MNAGLRAAIATDSQRPIAPVIHSTSAGDENGYRFLSVEALLRGKQGTVVRELEGRTKRAIDGLSSEGKPIGGRRLTMLGLVALKD